MVKCKTCGKEYHSCDRCNVFGNAAWRNVGWSLECAQAYFTKVLDLRRLEEELRLKQEKEQEQNKENEVG